MSRLLGDQWYLTLLLNFRWLNSLATFLGGHFPRAFDGEKIPEDPRIAALRAGLGIPRSDWALSYSFAAERVRRNPIYRKLRGE